ncbi:hypothetical protein ACFOZ0_29980 [Streptomyces yaanensis]|uniref:Uncharacterized protein n=1 Tax=Streptomyces yaanensis TaxID=1142239 RepID=A0ABV7SKE4_9ACTN|nr:hypothetical protein [Streptomyces sp. CGMCC 4.7035]WNC00434.1 hypothetical protein Q2K21_21545 [Streptomyces sp. CGMCC 4.7035]
MTATALRGHEKLVIQEALVKVRDIGPRVAGVLARSAEAATTPLALALAEARSVLEAAALKGGRTS